MRNRTGSPCSPRLRSARLFGLSAVLLLLLVGVFACRRKEAPGAAAPGPGGPAATVVPADAPPVIRDTAAGGSAPFAGVAEPRGAALDEKGRLWVADFGHSRLAIFDAAGGYLGGWGGTRGNGKFQLQEPAGVAIHGPDVYIADTWNGRVQHFTTGGEFRETVATGLYGPRGVAVAADGTLWISDSGNNRIGICPGGTCANPLRFVGKAGKGPAEVVSPIGIAVGPSGNVYVADIGNHRIQVLAADGHFSRSIAVAAWTGPMEPYLAVDAKETIYLSVPDGAKIEQHNSAGKILRAWDADDSGKKFVRPTGLALDSKNGVLYVMNSGNSTIVPLKLSQR